MSDGLSHLLPGAPENLLSVEARKRIQRAVIAAEKFTWEAEIAIRDRDLDPYSQKAEALRSKARFQRAKACLSAYRKEFSRINLPDREYRRYMDDEIESASYSLELSDFHKRLLQTDFFFPEEGEAQASTEQAIVDRQLAPKVLVESYLANFPDEKIKIRDLCWGARQHYREWKRWLAGQLKDGSTPDLAFRRLLSSNKKPLEFSKKPRPKGWE